MRGVADQVAFEALALIRQGIAAEQIAVLAADTGRWRLALESGFAALGVPVDVDAQVGLGETAFGQALLGLLRFAWFDGDRAELFRFLRSPFSGVPRATVDYAEGRLRGRGALRHDEVQGLLEELDYARLLAAPDRLAAPGDPAAAVSDQLRRMSASVAGLTANRLNGAGEAHAAALRATLRTLEQLAGVVRPGPGSRSTGPVWPASSSAPYSAPTTAAPAACRRSTCAAPARAASRPCSCWAWRRAAYPGRRARTRS